MHTGQIILTHSLIYLCTQLMNLLSKDEYYDIISWNSKGTAFKITKPKLFEQQVMPKYFDYIKYSEFSRDLRKWGFIRQKTGEDMGSFMNEKFQKERWDLLEELAGTSATGGDKSSRALSPKPEGTQKEDDDALNLTPTRSGSGMPKEATMEPEGSKSASKPDSSAPGDTSPADQGSLESAESSVLWQDISFPMKLLNVLSDRKTMHIIAWNPSGKSFSVLKPKLFEAEVMPEHFDSDKYSSFSRELRRWGFVRQSKGPEAGGFAHELFQEGRWDLVEKMDKPKDKKKATQSKDVDLQGSMDDIESGLPKAKRKSSFLPDPQGARDFAAQVLNAPYGMGGGKEKRTRKKVPEKYLLSPRLHRKMDIGTPEGSRFDKKTIFVMLLAVGMLGLGVGLFFILTGSGAGGLTAGTASTQGVDCAGLKLSEELGAVSASEVSPEAQDACT